MTRMSDTVNHQPSDFLDEFILIEDEPVRKGEEGTEVNPRLEQLRAAVVLTQSPTQGL